MIFVNFKQLNVHSKVLNIVYNVILTPSVVTTQRDAEVAESMVKLISSHYEINTQTAAKNTVENIHQSWIPPLVNRYAP